MENKQRVMSPEKANFLAQSKKFWNPGKTQFWIDLGIDLVIDRREGYFLYDMDGHRLIDAHLNGGTFNLGHRNPELIATLNKAMERFDIGNHHFPSLMRTELAEELARTAPGDLQYTIYGSGGGEAVDIAIKTARHATQKRKIVSVIKAYHGHTGLAVKAGDPRFSKLFLSEGSPDEFIHVPFNDLDAMEEALSGKDVACVLMETIPATYGFPMPEEGYLPGVKQLCEKFDALYIADEVQTGLMRTGELWGITKYGVEPDLLVIGKGISGGIYPITCVVVGKDHAGWLTEDGFGHMATMAGAELGCVVALKVLEMVQRDEVRSSVQFITDYMSKHLAAIQQRHGDFFIGIRQNGLVMGLEFDHPKGAMMVSKALYENGVWAIFSTLDPRVLQFKPGLLMTPDLCEDLVNRVDVAIGQARTIAQGRLVKTHPPSPPPEPGTGKLSPEDIQRVTRRVRELLADKGLNSDGGLGLKLTPAQVAKMIDHTLLKPDANQQDIETLCAEARENGFYSVCVNSSNVRQAANGLRGSDVKICSVVGFPLGAMATDIKAMEARKAIREGAGEIDMVINVGALKSGDDEAVLEDIRKVVEACKDGRALCKVILETALLTDEEKIRACQLSMRADANFVKTSTGFGPGGATVQDVALMKSTVAPKNLQVKASGGVRNYGDAMRMVSAGATRLGVSSGIAIVEEAQAVAEGRAYVPKGKKGNY